MVRNSLCVYPLGYPVSIDAGHAAAGTHEFAKDWATEWNDEWTTEALEAARESWGPGEARFDARPVHVQISGRRGPAPVKTPPRFKSRAGWIQLVCDASNRGAFVSAARTARLRINSGLLSDRHWFRRHLLEPLVLAALDEIYFTPLHAACVTRGEKTVLLCGDSGAGKSTLAYACARRGWTLVSDDSVHLTPLPANTVAGASSIIRLREPARALFPELRGEPAGLAPNGKTAIEIHPRTRGFAVARFAEPSHIVFLSRGAVAGGRGKTRLRPYEPHLALAYFLKYLWHCDTSAHENRLQKLLALGAHRLEYENVDSAVDALESLLAKS